MKIDNMSTLNLDVDWINVMYIEKFDNIHYDKHIHSRFLFAYQSSLHIKVILFQYLHIGVKL